MEMEQNQNNMIFINTNPYGFIPGQGITLMADFFNFFKCQTVGMLEDALEKEMATHFSIVDWRIPWTEEPGRLQSMGSQESDVTE